MTTGVGPRVNLERPWEELGPLPDRTPEWTRPGEWRGDATFNLLRLHRELFQRFGKEAHQAMRDALRQEFPALDQNRTHIEVMALAAWSNVSLAEATERALRLFRTVAESGEG